MRKHRLALPTATTLFLVTFASSLAAAVELTDIELETVKRQAQHQFAQLQQEVNQRLAVETGQNIRSEQDVLGKLLPGDISSRLFNRIGTEKNPLLREVLIDFWLTEQIRNSQIGSVDAETLQSIQAMQPVIHIPHHEMVHHTMPAFNIAQLAENLLQIQQHQSDAIHLRDDLNALVEAFSSASNSDSFKAAELAYAQISRLQQANLISRFKEGLGQRPENAQALISMMSVSEIEPNGLMLVIQSGDLVSARKALRMPMTENQALMLAEQALLRPEIGGLAIQVWLENGGEADQLLWPMLADQHLGADAARQLAQHSRRLISTIERDIHTAIPLARLRMLLALKLNGSEASIALLRELMNAEWLSAKQQQTVASWL